jgi:ribosome-binding protein aMBF1 (putative translation factor)
MECFRCGISGNEARLFDAISDEGIVSLCGKCSDEENLPLIRKPTTFQLKESERKTTIHDRLAARMETSKEVHEEVQTEAQKREELKLKEETTLRDIVDKNFHKDLSEESKPRTDLIDNFHWVIMRARRSKKITVEQLGKEIAESGAAIKMAEKGVLPEDDFRLVNKLENFLGIRIIKNRPAENIEITMTVQDEPPKVLGFDNATTENLTISDLQEMKKQKEQDEEDVEGVQEDEDIAEKKVPLEDKEDLNDEEMDDLIFGRKV